MLAFTMLLVVNNWRIGITCQGSALLDHHHHHHHNHHHHHHHSAWEGSMGRSRQTLPVLTSDKREEKSVWWSIYPRSCTWVTSPQELHNWLADDLRWWLSDALRPEPININNNIVFNKNFPQSFLYQERKYCWEEKPVEMVEQLEIGSTLIGILILTLIRFFLYSISSVNF